MQDRKQTILSRETIFAVFQDGEKAGQDGVAIMQSRFMDCPELMSVWMVGYCGYPVHDAFRAADHVSIDPIVAEINGRNYTFDTSLHLA